jgi:hypothetical protein
VKARQARIDIEARTAGEEARAELERKIKAADMARVESDTKLQVLERARNEAALEATTVTTAQKEREARVIRAEAEKEAASREGEAARIRSEKEGQGTQAKLTAEAEGRKAAASALQAEREAEANGRQAMLVAEAAGRNAGGDADGAARLAMLAAEAEGLDRKNRALAELSEGARLIMVLEKVPEIIEQAGHAGERVVGSAFEHVGQGLARIDEVRILDMGGRNGEEPSPVAGFALNVPRVVAGTLAQFKALGIDADRLLKVVGLDAKKFEAMLGRAITEAGNGHKRPDSVTARAEDVEAAR